MLTGAAASASLWDNLDHLNPFAMLRSLHLIFFLLEFFGSYYRFLLLVFTAESLTLSLFLPTFPDTLIHISKHFLFPSKRSKVTFLYKKCYTNILLSPTFFEFHQFCAFKCSQVYGLFSAQCYSFQKNVH